MVDHVIWGAAGHALVLSDIIENSSDRVIAVFDNNLEITSPLLGVPIYHGKDGFASWMDAHREMRDSIVASVAIGGSRGMERCDIADMFLRAGFQLATHVHTKSVIAGNAIVSAGCHVLAGAVLGVKARLEENVILNTNSTVDHECVLHKGVHIAPAATLCGCVEVGEHTMIGAGATVLPKLKIGKNVIVAAGAVVTRDVAEGSLVMGVPAKIVRRDNCE